MRPATMYTALRALPALALAGCDLSADFLFSGNIEGVEDVLAIEGDDGTPFITPAAITQYSDIAANARFAEIATSRTAQLGGASLEFLGTGGPICVWVDPELAYWNQAIGDASGEGERQYTYPDNVFDDGDIDLTGGLSVFYTGTPGEVMGDFVVFYEDSLGNEVPVPLVECLPPGDPTNPATVFAAGRASSEYCDIPATRLGAAYTIAMTAWAVPLDDDRLSFGFLVAEGSCQDLVDLTKAALFDGGLQGQPNDTQMAECVITGESLRPEDPGPHIGRPDDLVWEGSIDFEHAFCGATVNDADPLDRFCRSEADDVLDAGERCDWRAAEDTRCYCGDPLDTPEAGGL
jgi:hypothetical protein